MQKWTALVFATVIVAGCAVDHPTYGPDGHAAHSINCSGSALTWNACYEKAGEVCGAQGYTVVQQNGSSSVAGGAGGSSAFFGPVLSRTLLVECKGARS
jgi:hypothetical protein